MSDATVNTSTKLLPGELGLSLKLAGLFSIRMLGIFIILPVLTLYSQSLTGSTPFLTGLVFASYALTQILLQPIFGIVSDKMGRKPALIAGLGLFIVGSIILMFASHVYVAILGRIIQGAGAVSAVVLALATDLTREYIRSKVMAMIGVSIGLTFGVAVSLAPIIYMVAKGYGIFGVCALMGALGIYATIKFIPDAPMPTEAMKTKRESISELTRIAFSNGNVVRLYFGAFMLHLLLTMTFAAMPSLLSQLEISGGSATLYYVSTFFISCIIMFACVGLAERFYRHRILFLVAILFLALAYLGLIISEEGSHALFFWGLLLFFFGFNVMEAMQPSIMSRAADQHYRGTIMGVFSSSQFLGTSIGGMLGATISGYFGVQYVFYLAFLLAAVWFAIAWPMQNPVKPQKKADA